MKLKGDTIIIALRKGRFHFLLASQCLYCYFFYQLWQLDKTYILSLNKKDRTIMEPSIFMKSKDQSYQILKSTLESKDFFENQCNCLHQIQSMTFSDTCII